MSANIFKLQLIKIAKWFSLVMPIVVLFYNENGLEQFEVMLLQGIYSVSIVVLEIPSGYFADVLGRKNTLVVGAVLGFLGFSIYTLSHGFYGFLLAEIILGIGQSLISGADSAMLYDTLAANKKQDQYLKYEGRITSIGNFAEALAGTLGGLLATFSLRTPYFFQAGVAFLAIPAALTLVEPVREKVMKKLRFADILFIFKHTIHENKRLRNYVFISAVMGCSTLSMAWFVQPYFKVIGVPLALYGILWTVLNLLVGLTSLYASKIEALFGEKRILWFVMLMLTLNYVAVGLFQAYWALIFLVLFYLVRGFATPVLKDYINKNTEANIRATVLSVRNFIIRLLFAAIGPALGYMTDHYTLSMALVLAGSVFLFSGSVILLLMRRLA